MTREELRRGQARLYRRLYAPEAFRARLLGNLERFQNVTYRPEAIRPAKVLMGLRLWWNYVRKGKEARRFFRGILRRALSLSPRSLRQIIMMLGMYKHFCEVHGGPSPWSPSWLADTPAEAPTSAPRQEPVQLHRA
jgi:hypothetical protein